MTTRVLALIALLVLTGLASCASPTPEAETEPASEPAAAPAPAAEPTPDEAVAALDAMCAEAATAIAERQAAQSLYERLGKTEGIRAIASDIVDFHLDNPRIAPRHKDSDVAAVKHAVATFFITGAGGPEVYEGKDMPTAHRGMNIDEGEFVAALDDAMAALDKNGVGPREKEEVLAILWGLKSEVVHL